MCSIFGIKSKSIHALPKEHYFELQKDHSNIDDLLSLLKDPKKIQAITSATYDYVLQNHTHNP